ncbi:unnamed protein product [Phytomonas sp. EM1]|nr:unnamed protein product [Phytomonas sp. EM1]|eukprot:CCW61785.1 unnamed protein product [Phytomonas sp. isolate EM1]
MPLRQAKAKKESLEPLAAAATDAVRQQQYQDIEERRLKEWENYQRSHRSAEMRNCSRAFLDISIGDVLTGRLVVELFDQVVPATVSHFCSLVTGSAGTDPATGIKKDYLHCPLSFIEREHKLLVFGERNVAWVDPIADENFALRHAERGLLTMISYGPHTANYAFGITLAPSPSMDFRQVVFGKIVTGLSVLGKLENLPVDAVGRPLSPAGISFCGALTGSRPSGRWNQSPVIEQHSVEEVADQQ